MINKNMIHDDVSVYIIFSGVDTDSIFFESLEKNVNNVKVNKIKYSNNSIILRNSNFIKSLSKSFILHAFALLFVLIVFYISSELDFDSLAMAMPGIAGIVMLSFPYNVFTKIPLSITIKDKSVIYNPIWKEKTLLNKNEYSGIKNEGESEYYFYFVNEAGEMTAPLFFICQRNENSMKLMNQIEAKLKLD